MTLYHHLETLFTATSPHFRGATLAEFHAAWTGATATLTTGIAA